jgi:hypothetical protein
MYNVTKLILHLAVCTRHFFILLLFSSFPEFTYPYQIIIIRQIIPTRMRWAGIWHARKRGRKEIDHLEDRGVDGRLVLEWILGRLVGGGVLWSGFFWHRIGIGDVQS